MNENNVIDIKEEIMVRQVEENAVQLIKMGNSGNNFCITISNNALVALRQDRTFPIKFIAGEKEKTIIVMRNTVFRTGMTKTGVEKIELTEDDVQFVSVDEAGDYYCIVVTKNALIGMKEKGATYPLELLSNGQKKTITVMSSTTFKNRVKLHNKLAEQAKEQVQTTLEVEREVNSISNDIAKLTL